jgi:5-formyltetrahydrofolate cyclo-ligase
MVVPPTALQKALMSEKKILRDKLRKDRQRFVKYRESSKFTVANQALQIFTSFLKSNDCVAGYAAIGGEPDIVHLLDLAIGLGLQTALPHIADRQAPITFKLWQSGEPMERAPFGFSQPATNARPAQPDVILTPLLGFDRALNRLGQGAGHYDRVFAASPDALRVGIAWSVQQVDELPVDPWDIPLDAVLTEQEWIVGAGDRFNRKE